MKTVPLRFVADVRTSSVDKHDHEGELPVQLCNYVDVYRKDVVRPGPDLMRATATPEEIARFRLKNGDTVLTKDSEDPAEMGISAFIDETADDFVCGYHLAIARPNGAVHAKFLNWAIRSRPVLDHFTQHSSGISRYGLSLSGLRSAPIPYTESEEQRRIADFLDDRVSRIHQVITARRAQAALLEEERRAVAESLVWTGVATSGSSRKSIDPAPSSPAHWRRLPNRYLLRESPALSTTGEEELLSVSHLTGVTSRAEKNVNMFMADSLVGYKIVTPGDLVINTLWAWMGALGISPIGGIVSPAYGVYAPLPGAPFLDRYYDRLYRSSAYVCEMTRHSKGVWSSRLRLYPDTFLSLTTVNPPLEEQKLIADEIDRSVGAHSSRIRQVLRIAELLEEYKQSLITAAVSGDLDVSTAGSGIPG